MRHTKPLRRNCVVIGLGSAIDPTTLELPGTTGQVLTATTGAPPAFAAPAAVNLTTGVSGILPVANGGTGQAIGAIAIMQFIGAAVPQNATSYLGRDDSATETDIRFVSPVTGASTVGAASVSAAPPAGQTFTYRLFINGSAGAANITISSAGPTATATMSNPISAGDTLSFRVIASATAGVTDHAVTLAIRVTG